MLGFTPTVIRLYYASLLLIIIVILSFVLYSCNLHCPMSYSLDLVSASNTLRVTRS